MYAGMCITEYGKLKTNANGKNRNLLYADNLFILLQQLGARTCSSKSNREQAPWIITLGDRPKYCRC